MEPKPHMTVRQIDPDGNPDEIVGRGWVHIERMDNNCWWCNFDGLTFFIEVVKKKKGKRTRTSLMFVPQSFQTWEEAKKALGRRGEGKRRRVKK
jgi:hypothetical protein